MKHNSISISIATGAAVGLNLGTIVGAFRYVTAFGRIAPGARSTDTPVITMLRWTARPAVFGGVAGAALGAGVFAVITAARS